MPEASAAFINWAEFSNVELVAGTGGSSKTVESAVWKGEKVALLTLRDGKPAAMEADVMARLGGHPHLIKLLGQTRKPTGANVLVTEFARHGALNGYLDELSDEGVSVSERCRITIALQIAMAMERMGAEKLIHCDLAARNVLVFNFDAFRPDRIVVKVSDFGLTAPGSTYIRQGSAQGSATYLPVRWMAPETHKLRKWNFATDVWSFGCVLYEIFADGAMPYMGVDDSEIVKRIVDKTLHLQRPERCSDHRVWGLIQQCTAHRACERPSFSEIAERLRAMLAGGAPPAAPPSSSPGAAQTPEAEMRAALARCQQAPAVARERTVRPGSKEWATVRGMLLGCFGGRHIALREVTWVANPKTIGAFQKYTPTGGNNIEFKVHGTCEESAKSIAKKGFTLPTKTDDKGRYVVASASADPDGDTSNTLLFGGGIYLTSKADKAAAFATGGNCTLIVCAVNQGKCWHVGAPDATLTHAKVLKKGFDSVYVPGGDKVQQDETVIYDPAAVLPLYTVRFCTTQVRTKAMFKQMKEQAQESNKDSLSENMMEETWERLRSTEDAEWCDALALLGSLCRAYSSASAWLVAKERRLRTVVRMLTHDNEVAQWLALRVFANIAFRSDTRQAELRNDALLEPLCTLLRDGSEAVKQKALVLACNLYSTPPTEQLSAAEKEQRMQVLRAVVAAVGPTVGDMTALYAFAALSNLVDSETGAAASRLIAPLVGRLCKIYPAAREDTDWTRWVVSLTSNLFQSEYNSKTEDFCRAAVREKLAEQLVLVLEERCDKDSATDRDIVNKVTYGLHFPDKTDLVRQLAGAGAFSELVQFLSWPSCRHKVACLLYWMTKQVPIPSSHVPDILKVLKTLPSVARRTSDPNFFLATTLLTAPDAALGKHGTSRAALQKIVDPAEKHTYTARYEKLKLDDDKCA
eukprot:TRINITY_DN19723_c0_g1_i3.p1 TRINITY_DN19723_c0_g1~~TRINITY_DN19723_c0_g1_i3.p1  ORF type:complete len:957 (+),score=280.76 TRINITY_DN19723_c0_g1_i3:111-2873(+)